MLTEKGALGFQHYACLYAWLAGSFARELDQGQITELTGPSLTAWLELLEPMPAFKDAVLQFKRAVTALQQRPDARLELAADFAGLFLMTEKSAALPYASCYQGDSSRFKQQSVQMKAILAQSGMTVAASFNEPEDHLALHLELLSHLSFALTEPQASRQALLRLRNDVLTYSLHWLPAFTQRCVHHDTFGFYAALSQLLLALVQMDERTTPAL